MSEFRTITDEGKRLTFREPETITPFKFEPILVKVEQLCGACEGEGKFPVKLDNEQIIYRDCEWCHGYGVLCS